MIVAGMSLLIMIFAVAGYAVVRSEPELDIRNKRVCLINFLMSQTVCFINR